MGIFNFSLENDDAGQISADVLAENQLAVAEDAADIVESETEVEEMTAAIEQAINETEELTDIQETLEDSVESGEGVSEDAARIADVAIESIRLRLGMPASVRATRVIPALEAFGSSASRLQATKIALESVKETLKSVWETIKRVAKQAWEAIVNFVKGVFDSATRLKNYVEKLSAQAATATGSPAETTLKNKSLATALSIDKKANLSTAEEIVKNTGELSASMILFVDMVIESSNTVSKMIAGGKTSDLPEVSTKLQEDLGKIMDQLPKAKTESDGSVYSSGPYGGGKYLIVEQKEVMGYKYSVLSSKVKKDDQVESIDALSVEEIKKLLKVAGALANDLDKAKVVVKQLETAKNAMAKAIDTSISVITKMDDEKSKEDIAGVKNAATLIRNLISNSNYIGRTIPAYTYQAARAAADYAAASLKNLKAQ